MPDLGLRPPRDRQRDAIAVVHALISRPAPWPPAEVQRAAVAIRALICRWERFQRSHPGQDVEIGPHLGRAVEALRGIQADLRPAAGM